MASNQGGSSLRQKAESLKSLSSASKRDNGQPEERTSTCVLAPDAEQRGRTRCRCVSGDAGIRRIVSRPYVLGFRCVGMVLFLLLAQHCIFKCAVAAPDPVRAITSARSEVGIALSSPVARRLDGHRGDYGDNSDDDSQDEKYVNGTDDRAKLLERRDPPFSVRLHGLSDPLQALSLTGELLLALVVVLGGFIFLVLPFLTCPQDSGSLSANSTQSSLANSSMSSLVNITAGHLANSTTSSLTKGRDRCGVEMSRLNALVFYVGLVFAYGMFSLLRLPSRVLRGPRRTRDQSEV